MRATTEIRVKSAEEILAHPRFAEARSAHIDGFADIFVRDPFQLRLLVDSSRLLLSALLVVLHAAHDDDDRTTWATLSRVQELVAAQGLSSPRRLADVIARFRATGYVQSARTQRDRRVRLLKPTARLIAKDRELEAMLFRPLHILYPARGYAALVGGDPAAHLAVRKAALRTIPGSIGWMHRHPAIMAILARDAGYIALLLVLQTMLAAPDHARETLSFKRIAARLHVSRSHVRNLFTDAAVAGHVRLAETGGFVAELQPAIVAAFDRFFADMESGRDAIGQAALASLQSPQLALTAPRA